MSKTKTPQSVIDALNTHPDRIEIEFAGARRSFVLSAYGAKLARAKGIDPVPSIGRLIAKIAPALGDVRKAREAGNASWIDAIAAQADGTVLDALCTILWWGLLPYDEDLELEVVEIHTTPRSLFRVFGEVWASTESFAADVDDDATAAKSEDTKGKEKGD